VAGQAGDSGTGHWEGVVAASKLDCRPWVASGRLDQPKGDQSVPTGLDGVNLLEVELLALAAATGAVAVVTQECVQELKPVPVGQVVGFLPADAGRGANRRTGRV
jgi:hypothetical protein